MVDPFTYVLRIKRTESGTRALPSGVFATMFDWSKQNAVDFRWAIDNRYVEFKFLNVKDAAVFRLRFDDGNFKFRVKT